MTRLDRIEPKLNESVPGDARDTTSPLVKVEDCERLTLGDSLSPKSRMQLVDWLVANKTGDDRIRAGLPKDWKCGDKTGTGEHGSTNDTAVIWPTSGNPILVSAYLTGTKQNLAKRLPRFRAPWSKQSKHEALEQRGDTGLHPSHMLASAGLAEPAVGIGIPPILNCRLVVDDHHLRAAEGVQPLPSEFAAEA